MTYGPPAQNLSGTIRSFTRRTQLSSFLVQSLHLVVLQVYTVYSFWRILAIVLSLEIFVSLDPGGIW